MKDKKICPQCKSEISVEAKFCGKCGAVQIENKETKPSDSSKKKKWIIPVAIILLAIVVGVTVFFVLKNKKESQNPVTTLISYFENEQYEDAYKLYEEDIKSDEKLYNELVKKLREKLQESKVNYYEESITYEQIRDVVKAVQNYKIPELNSELSEVMGYADYLCGSRVNYQTAEKMMKENNFKIAIQHYSEVWSEDSYYEDAQKKKGDAIGYYKKDILSQAENYARDKEYDSAVSLLKEALKVIPGDADIQTQINVYTKTSDEEYINNTIEEAKTSYKNGDYENALSKLKLIEGYNNQIAKDLYSKYFDEFLTHVIDEAEKLFKEKGHSEAYLMLYEYNDYFSNCAEYTEKLEYYINLAPVSLMEMESFDSNEWDVIEKAEPEDHLGNYYGVSDIITCDENDQWIEYHVDAKYARISGTVALYKGHSGYSGPSSVGKIEIYADDELVYTSPNVGAKSEAVHFDVNISGKKFIKIKVYRVSSIPSLILNDFKFHKY